MPAQKRRLPSPSSKPRDDVEATASDAAAGGGVGEGRGGRPPLPSRDAAKRWLTDPEPQQGFEDGELDDVIETGLHRIFLSRCACCVLDPRANMAKKLVCAGLADSDAEDDGGADGDSEFSQSDGGGNDG